MTQPSTPDLEPIRLAGHARSILACPASARLVVEGEEHAIDDEEVGLTDHRGVPTLLCPADSPIARAAAAHGSALLTLGSGLGPEDGAEREDTLMLAGRLERTGYERCDCCQEVRHVVGLDLNFVLLARGEGQRQQRVPLSEFLSPHHHLNRGHLQRSVEHANDCHQVELRQSVALATGTRPGDLLAVRIARLTPADVLLQWVDPDGAHQQLLEFSRPARDLVDLGELLRLGLHAGLC